VCHLKENDFDENLRLGAIKIRDYLRNVSQGILVTTDDQASGIPIDGNGRWSKAVIWILPGGGSTAALLVASGVSESSEATTSAWKLCARVLGSATQNGGNG
jgi:hypothetical protein